MEIEKFVKEIKKFAREIESINPENIQELREYLDIELNTEKLSEILEEQVSEYAIDIIRKYNIPLYYSPYVGIDETIVKLLKSKNINEFLRNLKEYRDFMETWRDNEITLAEDFIDEIIPPHMTLCAVKYQYWYGCVSLSGHSFVLKVYYTDRDISEEKFERVLEAEGIDYDEVLTKDELREKLLEDYKYRQRLGEGCWGTPSLEDFEYIVVL